MNEIRRPIREADEVASFHAIMNRFPLPDFVVGYTVDLGDFDDEPSVWVRFQTTQRFPESQEELLSVGNHLSELVKGAHEYLREHFPQRYPYFRFADSATNSCSGLLH